MQVGEKNVLTDHLLVHALQRQQRAARGAQCCV